jgi:NAD(P)H dehydrogenase (quinone)
MTQKLSGISMKNILIIVAHPKKESFSFAMADTYKKSAQQHGHTVELLDLYRCDHPQPFVTYDDANHIETTKAVEFFQAKISWANEIVFVFPYWWGSMPAILKNFIDSNLLRGFAFQYVNSRPQGMLQGKSVRILTTTGAPSFIYMLTGANRRLRGMWQKQIVEFCGMKLAGCHIYGGVDTSGKNTEKILEKIARLGG